jgi:hypothetical protein
MNTSSKCQRSPGLGRRRRSWLAKVWANAPAPDRLVGNHHTALGQHQLNIPEAEAERVVQPNGVADDFGREAVMVVRIRSAFHPATMPHQSTSRHPIKLT